MASTVHEKYRKDYGYSVKTTQFNEPAWIHFNKYLRKVKLLFKSCRAPTTVPILSSLYLVLIIRSSILITLYTDYRVFFFLVNLYIILNIPHIHFYLGHWMKIWVSAVWLEAKVYTFLFGVSCITRFQIN